MKSIYLDAFTALLIVAVAATGGLICGVFPVSDNLVAWLWAFQFVLNILILFNWFKRDVKRLGIERSKVNNTAFFLIPGIAVLAHIYGTRKLAASAFYTIAAVCILMLYQYSFKTAYEAGERYSSSRIKSTIADRHFESDEMIVFQRVFKEITDKGMTPYVKVAAGVEGVLVPREYVRSGTIVLDVSPISIKGFKWADTSMSFYATFSGQVTKISVPFDSLLSIYAKETGDGIKFSWYE